MATEIIMPRVDMDMTEGKVALWYVKNGDTVSKGQVIFEIETDKATMEVDAPVAGTISGIQNFGDESILVGTNLGWILAADETLNAQTLLDADAVVLDSSGSLDVASAGNPASNGETTISPQPVTVAGEFLSLLATPLARSLARANGVDLFALSGSGPNGRVLGVDVSQAAEAKAALGSSTSDLYLNWIAKAPGVPLVLLHGFGADQRGWRSLAALITGVAVIGIDLPNHGKSGSSAVRTFDELAVAVMARLDKEDVQEFHLLGHSMGGATAMAMVDLADQRLKSLTLLAPAGLGVDINRGFIDGLCDAHSEASLKLVLAELFHDENMLTSSFVATAFKQLESPQRRADLRAMADKLMPNGTQAAPKGAVLEGLRIPVKVIWGADDKIIPLVHAQGLPGRVALHVLKNVGHVAYLEAGEDVAALLMEQLR